MTLKERFESKFLPEPNSGCWLWVGGLTDIGYGGFWVNGRTLGAHRVSYELYIGPIGDKKVLHKCDNRCCVNPNHLFLGTSQDNSNDMVEKNRQARGESCGNSKLTKKDVEKIRQSDLSSRKLAEMFDISKTNILDIKNNKIWRFE